MNVNNTISRFIFLDFNFEVIFFTSQLCPAVFRYSMYLGNYIVTARLLINNWALRQQTALAPVRSLKQVHRVIS